MAGRWVQREGKGNAQVLTSVKFERESNVRAPTCLSETSKGNNPDNPSYTVWKSTMKSGQMDTSVPMVNGN